MVEEEQAKRKDKCDGCRDKEKDKEREEQIQERNRIKKKGKSCCEGKNQVHEW